jgi:2-methylcitrate synthase
MAEAKVLSGAGLRGQVAGQTALSTVGQAGAGLTYRGYDVRELAADAQFEEVAYLLLYGENCRPRPNWPPTAQAEQAARPAASLKEVLERIPADAHPMDVMRTGCSFLGNLEPELTSRAARQDRPPAGRVPGDHVLLVPLQPRRQAHRLRDRRATIGGHFLHLLHGKKPSELHVKVMNVSLILTPSTSSTPRPSPPGLRSTLSDLYSCITAAIGSLRGPLHGGANEAAMEMIERFSSPEEAVEGTLGMLARKDKIMGFGHAIYKDSDPRNEVIKGWSKSSLTKWVTRCCSRSPKPSTRPCGSRKAVPQRRLLPCLGVPLHGHPDQAVHADLRLLAPDRLGRARVRTARQQPHHPPERRVHRRRAAQVRANRTSLNGRGRTGI